MFVMVLVVAAITMFALHALGRIIRRIRILGCIQPIRTLHAVLERLTIAAALPYNIPSTAN